MFREQAIVMDCMKAVEHFDPGVRKFIWFKWLPVGCSRHDDQDFFHCDVLPFCLVDFQLLLLILDLLGIVIV